MYKSAFNTGEYSPHKSIEQGINWKALNYSLAAFGYLVLEELSGNGNYGLLDQIAALEWVKENIEAFGGNPKDVGIHIDGSGEVMSILTAGDDLWAEFRWNFSVGAFGVSIR
jgi:carboxylesterase type B